MQMTRAEKLTRQGVSKPNRLAYELVMQSWRTAASLEVLGK